LLQPGSQLLPSPTTLLGVVIVIKLERASRVVVVVAVAQVPGVKAEHLLDWSELQRELRLLWAPKLFLQACLLGAWPKQFLS